MLYDYLYNIHIKSQIVFMYDKCATINDMVTSALNILECHCRRVILRGLECMANVTALTQFHHHEEIKC